MFSDPTLIKAARRIYRTYCKIHSKLKKQPFGVAINKDTLRGYLIFKDKPILLPGECFIRLNEIEAEVSGKVVKILADDTTPVEFDQPLFLIDPS